MIVLIVNNIGISVFKTECESPIAADLNAPDAFFVSLQLVEICAWNIHSLDFFSTVEAVEQCRQLIFVLGLYTTRIVVVEKTFQAFVVKALYHQGYPKLGKEHAIIVMRHVTHVNNRERSNEQFSKCR